MTDFEEHPQEWEDNPEVFVPEHLLTYIHNTFGRAFAADESADDDSFEVSNGRFTHGGPLITNSGTYPNAWRIDMAPPYGRKKDYKAQIFLALDAGIDVIAGEPFDVSSGTLFVREFVKGKWHPLVRIDEVGATGAELVESISVENILAASKNNPTKRAKAIFRRLARSNMQATIE